MDALLKKEFDLHRARGTVHPLMKKYGIDAVPFRSEHMEKWRENFIGIQYRHPQTGFLITGAVDDVWINPKGELIVVDYKATAKDGRIESLSDSGWDAQYKRQMEIYQWLLRQNGFPVSRTGYFVYVNGRKDAQAFDGKLEFEVTVISHEGQDAWIPRLLVELKKCLDGELPPPDPECEFCAYRKAVINVTQTMESRDKRRSRITAHHESATLF